MKTKNITSLTIVVAICLLTAMAAGVAHGEIMDLTKEFSGGTDPVGNQPWVTISTTQQTPNIVKFKVDVPAQSLDPNKSEFVTGVYLNLNPSLNPSLLAITYDSGIAFTSWAKGTNAFKADGDGYYDVQINYASSNSGRLTSDASSSFTITYDDSPLSAQDFNYASVGGAKGAYFAAAHVQGIPPNSYSGWVGAKDGLHVVPEPSTFVSILAAAFCLIGLARLRRAA
jgi:hypothetical protein